MTATVAEPKLKKELVTTVYILNADGTKMLLLLHPKFEKWMPAGGHVEEDECIHEAAIREVKEEFNVAVDFSICSTETPAGFGNSEKLPSPFCVQRHTVNNPKHPPVHVHEDVVYIATLVAAEEPNIRTENDIPWKWVTKDDVLSMTSADVLPDVKYNLLYILKVLEDDSE